MKDILVFGLAMAIGLMSHADIVQIDFDVKDYDGNPIEGVNIECITKKVPLIPYAESEAIRKRFQTNRDGKSCARFQCWEGYVDCYLKADGYYPEKVRDVVFRATYEENKGRYVFKELQKSLSIKMRKIVNPINMVFHRLTKGNKKIPARKGRFGYDLEKGDWVKPIGKGEILDFIVVYDWQEDVNNRCCTGAILFCENGSGAYISKKYPCERFLVDYMVDTNAEYKTCFPFSWSRNLKTNEYIDHDIMKDDEYMVVRSRVKLDAKGDILEANYSQIHGPISIGYYFAIGSSFFNPRVNDLNLEYEQPR